MNLIFSLALLQGILTQTPNNEWQISFTPASVGSYLDGTDLVVMVVEAGEKPADSPPAAQALILALRSCATVKAVLDSSALGTVAGLSDPDIVAKTKMQPANIIAVVRVFAGSINSKPSATVSFYNSKDGKILAGALVEQGSVLAARQSAPTGVQANVAQTVMTVAGQTQQGDSQEAYDKQQVWYDEKGKPHAGLHGAPLVGPQFYRFIDRSDLAAEYSKKQQTRLILIGFLWGHSLSIPLLITGIPLWILANSMSTGTGSDAFLRNMGIGFTLAGAGVAVLSTVPAIIGAAISPQPVSAREARVLADQFNEKLRAKINYTD